MSSPLPRGGAFQQLVVNGTGEKVFGKRSENGLEKHKHSEDTPLPAGQTFKPARPACPELGELVPPASP